MNSWGGNSFQRARQKKDSTHLTNRKLSDLLPGILSKISIVHEEQSEFIIKCWPEIIGSVLSPMTEAISFIDGVLTVKVKNSTLYSLLNVRDKPVILKSLREKFPTVSIRGINFVMG